LLIVTATSEIKSARKRSMILELVRWFKGANVNVRKRYVPDSDRGPFPAYFHSPLVIHSDA
jgi:hypothetical protein